MTPSSEPTRELSFSVRSSSRLARDASSMISHPTAGLHGEAIDVAAWLFCVSFRYRSAAPAAPSDAEPCHQPNPSSDFT
jgi:hypothetical protein